MADAAWTKVFHDDLLQGARAANLKADEFGVYCTILFLIASRGAPIEDDRRWLAQMSGCSTRRVNQIIERLEAIPNKLVIRNGMIGNRKMLGVVKERDKKSSQARQAALARWHGDEAELPLGEASAGKENDFKSRKSGTKDEIKTGKKQPKRQKTAISDDADASPSVRARDSETQSLDSTHPTKTTDSGGAELNGAGSGRDERVPRLEDADLWGLYQAVAEASGHNPSQPAQVDRALRFVEQWRKDGIDFDLVVVPTIKAVISESREPTRTLGRFDARIRHEHARRAAQTGNGQAYVPPPSPLLDPPDEDPAFRPLRAALLERLGPGTFSRYVNRVRFEDPGEQPNGRHPLKVRDPMTGGLGLMDAERVQIVRKAAKQLGFTDVW